VEAAPGSPDDAAPVIRVAVFNVQELSREKLGGGEDGERHPQLEAAGAILKRIRPDILVLQEVDHEPGTPPGDGVLRDFQALYLMQGDAPLDYPHRYMAPSNTGELSGFDLNQLDGAAIAADVGTTAYGDDSWGFGRYPGQYAMAVLSRFPIDTASARTFRHFPWHELPGHHMPEGYFPDSVRTLLRLSSKSHWDLPVETPAGTLHLLVSHPTPPAFDGAEGRNRRRNFDEVGFWARYLDGEPALRDDSGRSGGWSGAPFVVMGDLNADPTRDEARFDGMTSIAQLLEHPAVRDPGPLVSSKGGLAAGGEGAEGAAEGGAERTAGPPHHPERNTAGFLGGRRVDYVLPDRRLTVVDGGVFWPHPTEDADGAVLAATASDHRLVWLDLAGPFPPR
jgi:endonuclease/exonuclease/phosphatase family metal-dependent hydrolase